LIPLERVVDHTLEHILVDILDSNLDNILGNNPAGIDLLLHMGYSKGHIPHLFCYYGSHSHVLALLLYLSYTLPYIDLDLAGRSHTQFDLDFLQCNAVYTHFYMLEGP
jgi:hypothetical protein